MPTHMMIDLETLGTSERASVAQVGVAVFDPLGEGVQRQAQWDIDTDSCRRLGGVVDDGTIRWWLVKQPKEAQLAVFGNGGISMEQALVNLTNEFRGAGSGPACTHVWSHGATFDIPIMTGYFTRAHVRCPWSYTKARDTRTLFDLAEGLAGWHRPKGEVAHEAVKDAVQQALDVQSAYRALRDLSDRARTAMGDAPTL